MIIADDTSMASQVKNVSALASIPVSCYPHATLNWSSGVVCTRVLLQFSLETLPKELAY